MESKVPHSPLRKNVATTNLLLKPESWKSTLASRDLILPGPRCRLEVAGRYSIDHSRLQVTIVRAEGLPTSRRSRCMVFVTFSIVNKLSDNPHASAIQKTREIPCNSNPTFADTFTIAQEWKELVVSTIHFQVVYCQRTAILQVKKKEIIAEGHLKLHTIQSSLRRGNTVWSSMDVLRFPCCMTKSIPARFLQGQTKAAVKVSIGQMQRGNILTVFIHKLANIPYSQNNTGVYVTATLVLPNYTTQKKKTNSSKVSCSDINICSQLSFDLSGIPLEHVILLLQVKAKHGLMIGKKTLVGRVLMGGCCFGSLTEQEHWQAVLIQKEKMICQEHELHF